MNALPSVERDPRAPRERDLPRQMPRDGADLASLDDAKIIAAPDDPRDRDEWRARLRRWRDDARVRLAYDGSRYERRDLAWTQTCFSLCMAWLWDEQLYDARTGSFTARAFVNANARLGGFDAVVLWHTYPNLGIDERDQFDVARAMRSLPALVSELRSLGVRVLVEYLPWDHREGNDDAAQVERLVRDTGVDGVFLDTLREAPAAIVARFDAAGLAVALESESNIPLARVADHPMSWAQWQADSATPGVLRARWFEQRHMLHQTRRWDTDRSPQLRTAWLNGVGMVVWENVFGSLVPWSARDASVFASLLPVQRAFARHFSQGEWTPLAPISADRDASIVASLFERDGSRLWSVATLAGEPIRGHGIIVDDRPGDRWFELITGKELAPRVRDGRVSLTLPSTNTEFAAVLAAPGRSIDEPLRALLEAQAARARAAERTSPSVPTRRFDPPRASVAAAPPATIRVAGGERSLAVRYRVRETGMYEPAPFRDLWKPLPPLLHRLERRTIVVRVDGCAVAASEVTNAEFARFVDATAYAPADRDGFLAHWRGTRPAPDQENEAVRNVSLDDARAYARWAGMRLPTEFEWQLAAQDSRFARLSPPVWNWTESEHTDGRTRFVILKGGSDAPARASEWYADAGVHEPDYSFKFLRAAPVLERSAWIGFRCAVSLDT